MGCSIHRCSGRLGLMVISRGALAVACVAALTSSALLAQPKSDPNARKLNDAQKKEFVAVQKMVDDVTTGKPAPDDLTIAWMRSDFLKAENNKAYVPFTVTIDRSKLSATNMSVYWRVISKGGAEPPPAAGKKEDKNAAKNYPYEDYTPATVPSGQGPIKISRSFSVGGGDYDIYVVVKEPSSDKKNAPPPKASILKQAVTVPDFWNGELSTSSVIVAERID